MVRRFSLGDRYIRLNPLIIGGVILLLAFVATRLLWGWALENISSSEGMLIALIATLLLWRYCWNALNSTFRAWAFTIEVNPNGDRLAHLEALVNKKFLRCLEIKYDLDSHQIMKIVYAKYGVNFKYVVVLGLISFLLLLIVYTVFFLIFAFFFSKWLTFTSSLPFLLILSVIGAIKSINENIIDKIDKCTSESSEGLIQIRVTIP